MKYVIEIKELDEAPKDWVTRSSWPANGLYMIKNESYSFYAVHEFGVNYVGNPEIFTSTPFVDAGETVSENLLLKAIAAASRAEVLK